MEILSLLLESFLTVALLPIGLYGGLYFAAGKKVALQLGGGLGALMILALVIGFLLHHKSIAYEGTVAKADSYQAYSRC